MLLVANLAIIKWSKNLKTDWNPNKRVLIWEHWVRAIQWIPTWQGSDDFQKSICPCALDERSLSIGRVNGTQVVWRGTLEHEWVWLSSGHWATVKLLRSPGKMLLSSEYFWSLHCYFSQFQCSQITASNLWVIMNQWTHGDDQLRVYIHQIPHLQPAAFPALQLLPLWWNNQKVAWASTIGPIANLTLPMLRLLSSKAQKRKILWKPWKPCHFGIHLKALVECFQMSTHLPGYQLFSSFFASFCIGQISQQQHKG